MPNSRITCAYSLTAVGARSVTNLAAAFKAVPIDWTLPRLYGLLPISDDGGIVSGNTVTRTLAFAMIPSETAAATCTLVPGDGSGSPIEAIVGEEGGEGDGYARAPYMTFTPVGKPPDRAATARAHMGVGTVLVLQGGSGFSGTPTVTFSGGELWPTGHQAAGTIELAGDAVSGIVVTDRGGPYGTFPDITISGVGAGTGATLVAGLTVIAFELLDGGVGYVPGTPGTTPTVVFTPYFKNEMPDSFNNQGSALSEFMRGVFQLALQTPVIAAVPVIT